MAVRVLPLYGSTGIDTPYGQASCLPAWFGGGPPPTQVGAVRRGAR